MLVNLIGLAFRWCRISVIYYGNKLQADGESTSVRLALLCNFSPGHRYVVPPGSVGAAQEPLKLYLGIKELIILRFL